MGTYTVLGWGSLIWDLDDLAPKVTGPWCMGAGPRLPMEFTRISPKRKLGLVVCLDPRHGALCQTHTIVSRRNEITAAVADLAARERTGPEMIGSVCLETGVSTGRHAEINARVRDWCADQGLTGAVWTDLPSNFADIQRNAFSIGHAIAYLRTLTGESLDEAVRYIQNAPPETDTPLRRALGTEAWWQGEARRLGLA